MTVVQFLLLVAYVTAAVMGTLFAFSQAGAWFGLAVALVFVIGPKVWKRLSPLGAELPPR